MIYLKDKGDQSEYEKSIALLEPMLKETESLTFKYSATSPVAEYYLDKGNPKRAKALMDDLNLALDDIDFQDRKQYLRIKARLTESEGNLKGSIGYYQELNTYRDSMDRSKSINQVLFSEQQYDRSIKNEQIAKLEVDQKIAESQLKTSKIIIGLSVISLAFLSLFLYQLFKKNKKISEQQKVLNAALNDKDILLREIHHRVKNNLQVVSSLLNLQSNFISDHKALAAINEGKNRVSSMALIHQNLYQEENLTSINSKQYFDDLIDNLYDSYNINEEDITLEKNIEDLNIDVDTMIPIGLIVNELVSNALKHAYAKNPSNGKLSIYLSKQNDKLILTISDNGIGVDEVDFLTSASFGNKLIAAFKTKLGASLKVKNDNGTHITLSIEKYKLVA